MLKGNSIFKSEKEETTSDIDRRLVSSLGYSLEEVNAASSASASASASASGRRGIGIGSFRDMLALPQQNMSNHRPIKTLESLTPEERLRHERCRNYALYGTKTPVMIIAAENKKATAKKKRTATPNSNIQQQSTMMMVASSLNTSMNDETINNYGSTVTTGRTEQKMAVKTEGQINYTIDGEVSVKREGERTIATVLPLSLASKSPAKSVPIKMDRKGSIAEGEDEAEIWGTGEGSDVSSSDSNQLHLSTDDDNPFTPATFGY
mmetsp:Transcript_23179/g.25853  ORF Transcript_23179/g.25853 Transcript_23179/m.25853 type:complete len:264 (-) Transcript_23179:266-1057(-)